MNEFTPPGYVRINHAMMCVIHHLNPVLTDEDLDALGPTEAEAKLFEAIHALQALLFEKKITAFFNRPIVGGLTEIPSDFWLNDDAGGNIASGRYWPFGPNRSYRDEKPNFSMFFREGEIEDALAAKPKSSKAGAKPKFDWPAYEEAFTAEVRARGVPSALNDKGWQSQADLVRFLQDLAQRDGLELPDSTAKPYAKAFLAKANIDDN